MDDLEELLTEWGRKWRKRQPPFDPPSLDPLPSARYQTLRGYLSATSGVIVLGVLVLAWLGIMSFMRSDAGAGRLSTGSDVTGTGYLIESADGRQVQLCLGGSRLMGPPSCSVVAVPVEGVQWDAVPGATRDQGVWYATHVTVRGTWTGSSVTVKSVVAAPQSSSAPPVPASCLGDATVGGSPSGSEDEAALRPLNAEVLGHPDRYAGLWRAASTEGLGPMVVEVVGNPSTAESKLRGLYLYPLCLVAAKFSETELNSTLNVIGRATQDWRAEVDYPSNRVIVSVGVLTEAVQRRLQPYLDRLVVSQLLQPG
jgi:hypothetical protein